ncbi:hypothetical protein I545_4975 [Mycobacterium kansasii 662]|uniref:Uncharacterized protein n=2 Tax=Mycobacterium kansasii TaxID=1768 RepID=A0A1V3WX89_MYCKA|nr:hypothetical protein I547_2673 [Mycobacterium kansasii 824]EUA12589.1 hypothetical protein I545_4975 [Mycobacterium kansasii 662]KEP39010.1 hypothetical protein MKSMC1_59950 [Mycobacterium kansasii]OOK71432.1 hypothetical protein BZL29_5535 [Mycobacterium kansasii]OOK75481.1 hypothetical protein BZL30_3995 [Mycobacterium kansasii]
MGSRGHPSVTPDRNCVSTDPPHRESPPLQTERKRHRRGAQDWS